MDAYGSAHVCISGGSRKQATLREVIGPTEWSLSASELIFSQSLTILYPLPRCQPHSSMDTRTQNYNS